VKRVNSDVDPRVTQTGERLPFTLFAAGKEERAGARHSGARRHQDLSTTQRYMHLSPVALDAAIRSLDGHRNESGNREE
jgi:hypothetical protein